MLDNYLSYFISWDYNIGFRVAVDKNIIESMPKVFQMRNK